MKAKYEKPLLAVESFVVAQAVARDCSDSIPKDQVNSNDSNNCFWDIGGGESLFILGAACTQDGESSGLVCYNNPSADSLIFRS